MLDEDKEVAAYEYDAWGSCKVVKDTDGIGTLNPIRWKSQYYDSDSGFYYINNRFYSATTKQFLDGGSPETALANATTIYGLNPHNSTLTNPLSEVYNEYTIETETELVYDAPELSKWQYFWNVSWKRFWGSKLGKLLSLVIFIAATILAIFCPAFTPYYISAVLGTTVSLVIGATIAGFRNKESFVDGFNNYINEELAPAFAISLTLAMVSFGVSKAVQAIQNAAPKCFKAGTLIACLDQAGKETLKPIEEIEVGDKVLAYDEETGEQGYKEVVRLFRNKTQEWHHVFVNGEEIVCTAEHPFYVEGKGFVPARELKERDNLLLSDGSKVEIDSLRIEHVEIPETTYNFEVKDFHTYYVSHSNVLVHNVCEKAAMRAAKRSENISINEKPIEVKNIKMVGENGQTYYAKAELYSNGKFIRNDLGGHLFKDGATLPKHFNAGTWTGSIKNPVFHGNGMHFWYS